MLGVSSQWQRVRIVREARGARPIAQRAPLILVETEAKRARSDGVALVDRGIQRRRLFLLELALLGRLHGLRFG